MDIADFKDFLETPINKLISGFGREVTQMTKNRLLEYQVNEFKRNYYSKTLLHRSESIKLTDFYLPLHVISLKNKESNKLKREPTDEISKLFGESHQLTLIGNAGSGKSTIVKYLFVNAILTDFKIPIKIELRYLNDYDGTLKDYIFDEIFLFEKLGFTSKIIDRLLGKGDFVFFFDGYDEITSNKKEATTKDIDRFVARYPDNYYLLTSRPYTNIETLPLFKNYLVCNLLDKEIPAFVKKQIPESEVELAQKIIKAISQIDNQSYRSFLSNPLLLSMFILTFQSYSEIPKKRSDFYKQVFDTLYSVHDSVSKLAFVREKQSGLPKEGFEELLRLFSFISYFDEKFIFKPEYLESKFTLIKQKKQELKFENASVIEDLQVAIGILNKEGVDYTFPHRSLQEYFAANYISNLSEANSELMLLRIRNSIETDWFYVFENEHFFALLAEQCYRSLVKNIVIPLLKHQISRVNKAKVTTETKFDTQTKIYLLGTQLLHEDMHDEEFQLDFCVNRMPKVLRLTENEDTLLISRTREYNKQALEELKKSIQLIKKNGERWLIDLHKKLEDRENSDMDIINLI
ncbi:MAG: hypothetical protein GQ574_28410 [Crocinitomix sp.]|nr:hypothetical protein [Crocinitomix sp.]